MVICNCIVQAGQIPEATEAALKTQLDGFAQRAFGAPAQINWVSIPEGNGFSAGEPSTSSVVSMRATAPVTPERREALLLELCHLWVDETHCTLDEVVGVISDPQPN